MHKVLVNIYLLIITATCFDNDVSCAKITAKSMSTIILYMLHNKRLKTLNIIKYTKLMHFLICYLVTIVVNLY